MTVVTLDDLMQSGIIHAQRMVRLGVELTPLVGVATGETHTVIAIPEYGDHTKKEGIRAFLKAKLAEMDAHAYTVVMEAWFTEFRKGHDPRRNNPDYLPSGDVKHRRECVTVLGCDRLGNQRHVMLEIKRVKNGRVDFEDITDQMPGHFDGPLAELLPKVTVQ